MPRLLRLGLRLSFSLAALLAAGSLGAAACGGSGTRAAAGDAGAAVDAAPGEAAPVDAGGVSVIVGQDGGGIDAAIPCNVTPGPHPLTESIVHGVQLDPSHTSPTLTIPDGFVIAGDISAAVADTDPGGLEVTALWTHVATGEETGVAPDAVKYSVVLRGGAYRAEYDVGFSGGWTQRAEESFEVCGDQVRHVALAPLPPRVPVKITVDHLERLGTAGSGKFYLHLQSAGGWADFVVSGATGSVTFDAALPLGGAYTGDINNVALPPFSITGDTQVSVPDVVTLSGQLTSGTPLFLSSSPYGASEVRCGDAGAVFWATPLAYSFPAPLGASCDLSVKLLLSDGTDAGSVVGEGLGVLGILTSPPVAESLSAAVTHDFVVPPVGPTFPFTPAIVDARGTPFAYSSMSVGSSQLSAPELAGYTWTGYKRGGTPTVVEGTYDVYLSPDLHD